MPVIPRPCVLAVTLVCLAAGLAGCALGSGSSKAGGPAPTPVSRQATATLTIRVAGGTPGSSLEEFMRHLARASGGRMRAQLVLYDMSATDVDQRLARDLARGRIDVADIAARAWESLGLTATSAFQSPFLLTSDALLDRVARDARITRPILDSVSTAGVTGLAVVPGGVRYVFAADRPLDSPQAFAGARIRVQESATTDAILRSLGARPITTIRNGGEVIAALRSGRLDAVEADMRTAVTNGYVKAAPHISSPLFAKVTTLAANSQRLRALGPTAAGWLRVAAARTAAAEIAGDDRTFWASACAAGLKPHPSTPAQLDALHTALLQVHSTLDGDQTARLAIDRMGLYAVREPAADPWMRCGRTAAGAARESVLDGAYEHTVTAEDEARAGSPPGNAGHYRVEFDHGRYAVFHLGPADPEQPGWDFARDPVEVGSVLVRGDVATLRPETSISVGSMPKIYRFELFRGRLRWHYVRGIEDFLMTADTWRKVG
jgi:TRAP-type C4-dicarboxylate transport system substrate-binding protein